MYVCRGMSARFSVLLSSGGLCLCENLGKSLKSFIRHIINELQWYAKHLDNLLYLSPQNKKVKLEISKDFTIQIKFIIHGLMATSQLLITLCTKIMFVLRIIGEKINQILLIVISVLSF